jgi:hypothetical protein
MGYAVRFFRSSAAVYEQARIALDTAWGLPNDLGTTTCIEPAVTAPRDSQGRVVLAVNDAFCSFTVAIDLLPQLLNSGAVEEIDRETYMEAVTPPSPAE